MDQATGVLTLTEFLLARIAEDEAEAQRSGSHNGGGTFARDNYGCLLIQPARVLSDIKAKREIVEDAQRAQRSIEQRGPSNPPTTSAIDGHVIALRSVVRRLASVYADHPDYRPEWRH